MAESQMGSEAEEPAGKDIDTTLTEERQDMRATADNRDDPTQYTQVEEREDIRAPVQNIDASTDSDPISDATSVGEKSKLDASIAPSSSHHRKNVSMHNSILSICGSLYFRISPVMDVERFARTKEDLQFTRSSARRVLARQHFQHQNQSASAETVTWFSKQSGH